MKKLSYVLLTLLVICSMTLTACAAKQGTAEVKEKKVDFKVGLLMDGPINDQGWNASAYAGLMKIEKDLGAKVAYSESVAQSDIEEQFRSYASQGYDLVIGHGYTFIDGAMKVSADYPDTTFLLTSCDVFQDPNVGSVSDDGLLKGFLGGVAAAAITDANKVGYIGGMEIPPIISGKNGFEAGAKYVNPNVEVITTLTGSFSDAGKAKEMAYTLINQGIDVLMVQADMAGLGAIEAATEKGIKVVGVNTDQNELAPDTIVTSSVADFPLAMSIAAKSVMDGSWKPSANIMGLKEGVVYLAPYHSFEDKLSDEKKAKIKEVEDKILADEINVKEIVESFGIK